ncbi:NAD(P)(+) transhydrogenase (Re/Si-specific) subunit beta [Pseudazoarcus pumilus]|uniref:NAD(P) transhydrogenase subunit beta n=1 Tax=Pseudazoarcus pumilus TaxID=2067960 RepID=A0A2I6S8N6_9RHOO|nr:NAD(P)(+) transhydrogenase (Re/Si-specific) subunit beta [Pseudazoarcus pumilus]AUN95591.1 NAD(P) transhydrogenase subunit beta [Pseudazoarcus pumilus]
MNWFVSMAYFLVTIAFIFGLKAMSSPVTARRGIVWAGFAMIAATVVTFFVSDLHNIGLMVLAIVLGGGVAWWSGKTVKMTDMPQMVAIYNGMGGGAAAGIAAIELVRGVDHSAMVSTLMVLGAIIGSVAFSGSCVAFAKLQGLMNKAIRLPQQNSINFFLTLITFGLGLTIGYSDDPSGFGIFLFFVLALALGVVLVLPIGGADMPVVISLLNAFTGLAVGFKGFVLGVPMLIVAGIVVGASGMLLTQLMAKAMNRPIRNIIFTPLSGAAVEGSGESQGTMRETSAMDAASLMRFGGKVIIVPGYGMAVAGAQHKVWEMAQLLEEAGVEVKFAIHPVAGRMPGHMNVLLAEAGVPYDRIFDLEEINNEFSQADVALVIGANDVVNPVARTDKSSPIYGMPILNADMARDAIVIKRGRGAGYSGIENALFFKENCSMLYGSAQDAVGEIIAQIKAFDS